MDDRAATNLRYKLFHLPPHLVLHHHTRFYSPFSRSKHSSPHNPHPTNNNPPRPQRNQVIPNLPTLPNPLVEALYKGYHRLSPPERAVVQKRRGNSKHVEQG